MRLKKNYLLTPLSILAIFMLATSTWSTTSTELKKEESKVGEGSSSKITFRDKNMDITTFLGQSDLGEPYAIIGGGLAHGEDYLRNFFLIDLEEEYKPDVAMDISGSSVNSSLKGVFSYVVTEFVPMFVLAAPQSFTNIASLLKSNGKYISNQICTAKAITSVTREIATKSVEYSKGTAYYLPENSTAYPFNIFFDGEMEKEELETLCFSLIVKPLIEQAGFKDVKLTENPYVHNRLKGLDSPVIEATKK
jgi:hypothetical protein